MDRALVTGASGYVGSRLAIGIGDVLRYLAEAPGIPETRSREIQIGSAEILTYGDMLDEMADALGLHRRPRIPVPLLTP